MLRAEGYRVVLANSNPATIMTDPDFADATYVEPLTADVLARIIERERPDAVLPTLGGQTALNLAMELANRGVLEANGCEMIGASAEAIACAEDRERFKAAMVEVGLAVPPSLVARSLDEAMAAPAVVGLPVIVRPAYILGGRGTGMAGTVDELAAVAADGLAASPIGEILIERSIAGWKEFELEVMRDRADNCVVICSIENFDAMGVHTGDSITVAPAQTLSDVEYQTDARRRLHLYPPHRRGDRRLQHPVCRQPHRRHAGGDRDESPGEPLLGAGLQGHGFPHRQDRSPPRRRLHARRDTQRHHAQDAGRLRAHHRLRRHEGAALGLREVPRGACRVGYVDAVGG